MGQDAGAGAPARFPEAEDYDTRVDQRAGEQFQVNGFVVFPQQLPAVAPVQLEADILRKKELLQVTAVVRQDTGPDQARQPKLNVRQDQAKKRAGVYQGIEQADPLRGTVRNENRQFQRGFDAISVRGEADGFRPRPGITFRRGFLVGDDWRSFLRHFLLTVLIVRIVFRAPASPGRICPKQPWV